MSAREVDPMLALVESWDTYLVTPPASPTTNTAHTPNSPDRLQRYGNGKAAGIAPTRYHLTDGTPVFPLPGEQEQSLLNSTFHANSEDPTSSLLWLLTLVSRNVELLRAAAHLFLQFNTQYATLAGSNAAAINDLREHHQHQLASLLEVADRHTASDMIVDSTVTEGVVLQQQEELDRLERECAAAERQLELQLQTTLLSFLSTSAPDAVAAANRKDDSLSWVSSSATASNGNSGGAGGGDGLYRAEVDVSRFAEVRKLAMPRQRRGASPGADPFSPLRLVPVRTIKLINEVGNASVDVMSSPASRKRAHDATLQPIILDVSPVSGLVQCLACCTGTHPGAVASSVSGAAEEHLLRLAHTRHSVLLFIGTEAAALDMIASCKAPELLLGASHSCHERFQPLPHHPVLRVLFTSRLWGANVILLWNPSQTPPSGTAEATVEDALELAYAWDADMFSVAVLEGARLPNSGPAGMTHASAAAAASAEARASALSSSTSSAVAFLSSQAVSMEVLRQLRNGVTRELLETSGTRRSRRWQGGTSTWLRVGGSGAATTAGTHMCPRAVGALYASQAIAGGAAAARAPNSPISVSSLSSSSLTSSPLNTSSFAPSSTGKAFRGPPVTFNTPLAIRAFLPLGEEYFVRERRSAHSGRGDDDDAGGGAGNGERGESGAGRGGGTTRGNARAATRGQSHPRGGSRGGTVLAARSSDVDLFSDDPQGFSNSSFTRSSFTVPSTASAGAANGGSARGGDGGDVARNRSGEAMGLEALIHYAFGEFAETL